MSKEPKPIVMVQSIELGEFAVNELSHLLHRAMENKDEPLRYEFQQLYMALRALENTGRKIELRVVPDEEDMED